MIAYVYWVGIALGSLGVLAAFLVCLLGIQRIMKRRIQALLARLIFAFTPGCTMGLVLSVLGEPLMGLFVGLILLWAGWDMTRPVPERGEGQR